MPRSLHISDYWLSERGPDGRFYQRKRSTDSQIGPFPWRSVNPTTGALISSGTFVFPYTKSIWDTKHLQDRVVGDSKEFLARSGGYISGGAKRYPDWGGPMILRDVGFTSVVAPGPFNTNPGSAFSGSSFLVPRSTVAGFAPVQSQALKGDLWSYGAKAIRATKPGEPDFSFPVFAGELREGVPRFIGSSFFRDRVNLARRSGREYLNVEFGWKPLIQDLKDLGSTILNSSEMIDSFLQGSGSTQRRRWDLPKTLTSGISTAVQAPHFAGGSTATGKESTTTWSQMTTIWFTGRFRYHIPMGDGQAERWARWNLLGRRLAGLSYDSLPETVWELAPWSWLVDWFADVGDAISNISLLGSDGVSLDYGYLMCDQVTTISQRTRVNTSSVPDLVGAVCGWNYVDRWRQRVRASRFGFGLRDVDFSPRQLAILAALGIDRRWYSEV